MIKKEQIYKEITSFLKNECLYLEDNEILNVDTNLIQLGLDSLKAFNLIVFLEDKYNVNIPEASASPIQLNSVKNIVELINSQQKIK